VPPATFQAAFAPDGKTLATAVLDDKEPAVRLWDVASGKEVLRTGKPRGVVLSVAFSADGRLLVSSGRGLSPEGLPFGEVKVWEAATGKLLHDLPGLGKESYSVAASPDGRFLAAAGWKDRTALWDLKAAGGPRLVWEDAGGGGHVAFSPDGKRLAFTTFLAVRLLDTATYKELPLRPGHTGMVKFVAFTPDGERVVSAGETVRVWEAATGKELRAVPGCLNRPEAAALAPDGKILVTGSQEGTTFWDLSSGKAIRTLPAEHGRARAAAFAPDGKVLTASTLVSMSTKDGVVSFTYRQEEWCQRWDPATGERLGRLGKALNVEFLAYSPDGTRLAAASGVIEVWDTATGEPVSRMVPERPGNMVESSAVSFSPDGKQLASGNWYGNVRLWDVATGKLVHRLDGHQGRVRAATFSPDGATVASASDDDTVRLWDAATGKLRHELAGHRGQVLAVAWSPDGKRVASASADTTLLIWDVANLKGVGRPPAALLTPEELEEAWAAFGTRYGDGCTGDRAMRRLTAAPASAVPFLKQRALKTGPESELLNRLIAELDDDSFAVREKASRELAKLGRAAEPALREALAATRSAEVRRRLKDLLQKVPPTRSFRRDLSPEQWRLIRAAAVLARIDTAESRAVLAKLADDPELGEVLPQVGNFEFVKELMASLERLGKKPTAKP
jgi:WD40 repeat protein